MIAFAKKHCLDLDALLFYKVDRAARSLFDYVELERWNRTTTCRSSRSHNRLTTRPRVT